MVAQGVIAVLFLFILLVRGQYVQKPSFRPTTIPTQIPTLKPTSTTAPSTQNPTPTCDVAYPTCGIRRHGRHSNPQIGTVQIVGFSVGSFLVCCTVCVLVREYGFPRKAELQAHNKLILQELADVKEQAVLSKAMQAQATQAQN